MKSIYIELIIIIILFIRNKGDTIYVGINGSDESDCGLSMYVDVSKCKTVVYACKQNKSEVIIDNGEYEEIETFTLEGDLTVEGEDRSDTKIGINSTSTMDLFSIPKKTIHLYLKNLHFLLHGVENSDLRSSIIYMLDSNNDCLVKITNCIFSLNPKVKTITGFSIFFNSSSGDNNTNGISVVNCDFVNIASRLWNTLIMLYQMNDVFFYNTSFANITTTGLNSKGEQDLSRGNPSCLMCVYYNTINISHCSVRWCNNTSGNGTFRFDDMLVSGVVEECVFALCSTLGPGCGLLINSVLEGKTFLTSNSSFIHCYQPQTGQGGGGAFFVSTAAGNVSFFNTSFVNCSVFNADYFGGAGYIGSNRTIFAGCSFWNCSAPYGNFLSFLICHYLFNDFIFIQFFYYRGCANLLYW
jgi:hypothetical protein